MNPRDIERAARQRRRLAGRIAGLPRPDAPPELLPLVMDAIAPKRATGLSRLLRRARRWASGWTAGRLLTGGAVLAGLAVAVWVTATALDGRPPLGPQLAQGPAATSATPAGLRLAGLEAGQGREVTFVAQLPGARSVSLVGSFNGWTPDRHVMRKSPAGDVFSLTLRLPPGRHLYAFLVDGKLLTPDASALLQEDDGFGNTNSVLIIEEDGVGPRPGRDSHERPL